MESSVYLKFGKGKLEILLFLTCNIFLHHDFLFLFCIFTVRKAIDLAFPDRVVGEHAQSPWLDLTKAVAVVKASQNARKVHNEGTRR
jgi:hypothetical protein